MAMKDEYGLTENQKKFADYCIAGMDETEAYRKAGYSPKYAHKNAGTLRKVKAVDEYIKMHTSTEQDERIATNTELLAFWSANMRNESLSMQERRENSRLLANSKGMFKTKVEVDADVDYVDILAKARNRMPKHSEIEQKLAEMSTTGSTKRD